jgi:aminopeptidase N
MEEEKGRRAAIAYLEGHRSALLAAETPTQAGHVRGANRGTEDSLINSVDDFYVQAKAMNVWWMLRDIVGETALAAALHNYKASDDKDPQYMQKLIETQAHRDLTWFFDDWVYHDRGLPELRIASVYVAPPQNGTYITTVTVENSGEAGAEVPVTLHLADGESAEKLMVRAKSKASIRLESPLAPQEVTVNDGSVPESNSTEHVYKIKP